MNIALQYLPKEASTWDVTRHLASVLHSPQFDPRADDERPINFQVELNPSPIGGVRNDGSGVLIMPTVKSAEKFLQWVKEHPIRMEGKKVRCYRQNLPTKRGVAETLEKTPYLDPDMLEARENILIGLQDTLHVDVVQFGVFYRPKYPTKEGEPLMPRAFSVEWEKKSTQEGIARLAFEYDHKLIRLILGNPLTEEHGSTIAINFANIHKIAVGHDIHPYICFDTYTPPVLERVEFYRSLTGDDSKDGMKYKQRIGSLDPGHARVAPFAKDLRIVLYDDRNTDIVEKFIAMCKIADITTHKAIIRCQGAYHVEADKQKFFCPNRLFKLEKELSSLTWPVAFQMEALLHNSILHTGEVESLLATVKDVCRQHPEDECAYLGNLLRRYSEELRSRNPRENPLKCFHRVRQGFDYRSARLSRGNFLCCHVSFSPTRLILEGPYATQSNRVIREYAGFEDHFIRVDFRDEDRLQYRWDRAVDGHSFLVERVGGTLKSGFKLAGRYFEFLAYSTSALREHAVWFMNPFEHPERGWVTSAYIRETLGDFKGTALLKQPSKYAARLAQAFTATDPSVKIRRAEWEEVPDLGDGTYLFTDGVGTISQALADKIWDKLCEPRSDNGINSVKPSAYQIRFMGFKGVVNVDKQLDSHPQGIQMRLRPSMRKFDNLGLDEAEIEIAQAFEHTNTACLNRPLVMLLEDLGVRREVFQNLQDEAVAEARCVDESIAHFCKVLDSHGMGGSYRLSYLLKRIEQDLKLNIRSKGRKKGIDNHFLRQLRQVAVTSVLREIKHSARIPIPDSYLLVGVADEGPAYEAAGHKSVYILPEGHIYACVQTSPDSEPIWLEGTCSISRSPVVHPGDVQRVRAIGKPPTDKLCLFAHLKNCVVLPSVGKRSLASCLGGGDVDGDLFAVIQHHPLLPPRREAPANYESCGTFKLDRDSEVEDICDFIVEYIRSDVLGLLSDRLLVIADQSKYGIFDKDCAKLAALCSQAVDYPKQGIPVDLDEHKLPKTLIRCKPDWHGAEVVSPRQTDYYESNRALGYLYRAIQIEDLEPTLPPTTESTSGDPISIALSPMVTSRIGREHDSDTLELIEGLFSKYRGELKYICATHTISVLPGARLEESEVAIGTILDKCSQKRLRKDRMYRMRLHASTLAREIQSRMVDKPHIATPHELTVGLKRAWCAWEFSMKKKGEFGAITFGFIALGVIFDCLDGLNGSTITTSLESREESKVYEDCFED